MVALDGRTSSLGSKMKLVRAVLLTLRVWGGRITFSAVIVKSTTNIEQLFLLILLNKVFAEDAASGEVTGD
jgi:hypothetical protein